MTGRAPSARHEPALRLPLPALLAYAAPGLGFGFMMLMVSTYFMKFATDVLAIPAAAMGGILLLSRTWDAVVDPVAGYLSDRTRTRFGRRRPWLLAGAVPLALGFALVWSPPASLSPAALPWRAPLGASDHGGLVGLQSAPRTASPRGTCRGAPRRSAAPPPIALPRCRGS